jgi:uncharacterized protein (TIGR02996 family)
MIGDLPKMTTLIVREGPTICWSGNVSTTRLTIGRDSESDLVLTGDRVSREHADVEVRDGRVTVTDRGSVNGTFVNDRRINRATVLRPSDTVRIGRHVLTIELRAEDLFGQPNVVAARAIADDPTRPWDIGPNHSPLPGVFNAVTNPHSFDDPPTPRVMQAVDPVEADFLAQLRAQPNDDETRLVYADWLEESGQNIKAEFLRLQCRLLAGGVLLFDSDPDAVALQERLRALSPASDAWWRALTARPAIEKCEDVRFKFKCPKRWTELTPTEEPAVRHCGTCDRHVHFCATREEVIARGAAKECVAFDASLIRSEALADYDRAAAAKDEDDEVLMGDIA